MKPGAGWEPTPGDIYNRVAIHLSETVAHSQALRTRNEKSRGPFRVPGFHSLAFARELLARHLPLGIATIGGDRVLVLVLANSS